MPLKKKTYRDIYFKGVTLSKKEIDSLEKYKNNNYLSAKYLLEAYSEKEKIWEVKKLIKAYSILSEYKEENRIFKISKTFKNKIFTLFENLITHSNELKPSLRKKLILQ